MTVKIGNETFIMKPNGTKPNIPGIYATTYTYVYDVPNYDGPAKVVDLGALEYSMNFYGNKKTLTAPASIGVIMKDAPMYAEVSKSVINTYDTPTTANGGAYELYSGMTDYVTAISGSYARLSSGQWVDKDDVKIYTADTQLRSSVVNASYTAGEKWDTLALDVLGSPAATASFDGTSLRLDLSKTDALAVVSVLPDNSPFSNVTVSGNADKVQYLFTLKPDQRIAGYYVEKTPAGLNLNIKRPVQAKEGEQPLAGISVMLDPGHGGNDPGASGPLGLKYPEKMINLSTALKLKTELEKLGATVLMTRTADVAMSLDDRLTASRNARPDMFISIHANSMGDNVDISKVDGFAAFYREELAKPLAESVFNQVVSGLGRTNKGVRDKNFYVIRGTWTPSILFESGFVPNPYEFEWLTDDNEQTKLAQSVAQTILYYFKQ